MSEPQPIATAPRNGKRIFVGDEEGNVAAAFWHHPVGEKHGMWAYVLPEGATLIQQVDFEPVHWADAPKTFLKVPE